ncbi:GGDEF domain-containing protein [Nostoc sp. FACHB-152]|uniref:GGDEF domain-containing protein n=1 Tax=unclassified Nostoc TaxID=2593658 RepID=UPI001688ADB3|nr:MULTISPECIES: GGDEF domain-containing protein [unclassified Nostoc]MBD2451225.1 GGDEF domain-containing protein [Nostoc sp. FACHB-152]MBD2472237.1 GGDEF domain-containing protein [Nostoc sp. FACHB-145]
MKLIQILENIPKSFSIFLSILLIGLIGTLDYYIPPEIFIAIFYLIPIGIATWFAGKFTGIAISVISVITNLIVNQKYYIYYSDPSIPYWNTILVLIFFLFTNYLLTQQKIILKNLEKLARTDALTGLTNRLFFLDLANIEINKSLRHHEPLTIAYFDIDNFKAVNDQFGHSVGDRLLCLVANTAKNNLRNIDIIARFGGDEFAILLPRTSYDVAGIVLQRLKSTLLATMEQQNWPITFSIGAITFNTPPPSVSQMIEKADNLMYSAKKKGKNLLHHKLEI